ncbi:MULTISPECIES: acetyl-CoA hydrolase/transferase family protein [unclassified Brevundimonas]|uniref:acetyl-CoA hydrolase/transferase family protein n=1 Tax=unclassified Brevundimonas TaxID=2622653 RepID=UPI0025BE92EC|nr:MULTISPECIES: acetyl-CoA hydrolase/transferase C-terminal domain-containing protein [unclassified Brevundimonas]
MTDYAAEYSKRLTTAPEAAALIPSGAKVAMGLGVSQPPALLAALAARAEAGDVADVNIYYLLSTKTAGETVLRYELTDRLRPYSLFHGAIERALDKRGREEGRQAVWFIPSGFQQAPDVLVNQVKVDTLVTTVSAMDEDGYFSFGINADYSVAVARSGARLILEVNENFPRLAGDNRVHISEVAAIVENNVPVIEAGKAPGLPQDEIIGGIIADMIADGSCLQMGIGALPDAVCDALKNHKDLGVHTELMTPGLIKLIKDGVINNSRKTIHKGKSVLTFAMGTQADYDFMHNNPDFESYGVEYVNDPAVISQNDNVVSVNATLQIDLFGACCSEFLNGRQFTASGGQLDFVRGASRSRGGKSIIACHSTAAKGTVSRIVARLDGPVTTPRNDVQWVVTEHGAVNLRGLTDGERARALISIAAPDFREGLEADAKALGLI